MTITRIKKNKEFRLVYRRGKSYSNSFLVIYVFKNNLLQTDNNSNSKVNRVGIVVSKKVGKSVVRNRIKRLIKECYRLEFTEIESGYDIVLIARPSIKGKTYNEVLSSMKNIFNKAGLIKL